MGRKSTKKTAAPHKTSGSAATLPLRPLTARESIVARAVADFAANKAPKKKVPAEPAWLKKFRRLKVPMKSEMRVFLSAPFVDVLTKRRSSGFIGPPTPAQVQVERRFSNFLVNEVSKISGSFLGSTMNHLLVRVEDSAQGYKKYVKQLRDARAKLQQLERGSPEHKKAVREYLAVEKRYVKGLITWGATHFFIADTFMRQRFPKWSKELRRLVVTQMGMKFGILSEAHYINLAEKIIAPERRKVTKTYRKLCGKRETTRIAKRIAVLSLEGAKTALKRLEAITRKPEENVTALKERLDATISA
jgi:hypothetical protein